MSFNAHQNFTPKVHLHDVGNALEMTNDKKQENNVENMLKSFKNRLM